jgi:xanthosine utilization system XapX-like protein
MSIKMFNVTASGVVANLNLNLSHASTPRPPGVAFFGVIVIYIGITSSAFAAKPKFKLKTSQKYQELAFEFPWVST